MFHKKGYNFSISYTTVKLFVTHEGSGLGNCLDDVKKLCNGANIEEGIAIFGSSAKDSREKIVNWLR